MSFGRLTFRRSLPRSAKHGSNRCATRTGKTWPDPAETNGRMQLLHTSIVAVALAVAQRGELANLKICTLFGNGCLGAADGRKSRPTVSAMGAERGIPEPRSQPGPDFIFTQIVSHRRHQLVENVGVNFIERVVIQRGKIIAVRKPGGTFSIGSRAVEKFYDRPKRCGGRNGGDPQKCGRQARSDGFAHGIHVPGDPFISLVAVNPKRYPAA